MQTQNTSSTQQGYVPASRAQRTTTTPTSKTYAVFFVRGGKWVLHLQTFSHACAQTECTYLCNALGLNARVFVQLP